MISLTSDDSYTITGRGQVFGFRGGALLAAGVRNPKDIVNTEVFIDGIQYLVKGFEHWAIVCFGECNHPVGLLVATPERLKTGQPKESVVFQLAESLRKAFNDAAGNSSSDFETLEDMPEYPRERWIAVGQAAYNHSRMTYARGYEEGMAAEREAWQ